MPTPPSAQPLLSLVPSGMKGRFSQASRSRHVREASILPSMAVTFCCPEIQDVGFPMEMLSIESQIRAIPSTVHKSRKRRLKEYGIKETQHSRYLGR